MLISLILLLFTTSLILKGISYIQEKCKVCPSKFQGQNLRQMDYRAIRATYLHHELDKLATTQENTRSSIQRNSHSICQSESHNQAQETSNS